MADSTTHVLRFECVDAEDKKFSLSFKNVKDAETVTQSQVQTLADAIVTNGGLWEQAPLQVTAAEIVTTEKTAFDATAGGDDA